MTLWKERRHRLRAWRAPWLGLRSGREEWMEMLGHRNAHAPPALRSHLCQTASRLGSSSIGPSDVPSQSRRASPPSRAPQAPFPSSPRSSRKATAGHPPAQPEPRQPTRTQTSCINHSLLPRPLAILPLPTISTFHSHPDDLPTPSPATSTSAPSFLLRSDRLDDWKRRRVLRRLRPVKRRTARKSRCETSAWELVERGFFGNPTTNTRHFSSRLTTVDRTPNPSTKTTTTLTTRRARLTVRSSLAIPNSEGAIDFFTTFIHSVLPFRLPDHEKHCVAGHRSPPSPSSHCDDEFLFDQVFLSRSERRFDAVPATASHRSPSSAPVAPF